ncbi:trypsin-like peptidase domain-containing protein [Actinotignum urinale]|uniref:S1C family serine protease n=1 Tax=Actinotignum urinale TaxID=190146 RepID=UPI002A840039|nr:trypsin-like peptidase domain-containing protein [Actinotignum urinale]MDY5128688.1 trypsin-like peptidase domain-containing protein [Actinotignum urinale]
MNNSSERRDTDEFSQSWDPYSQPRTFTHNDANSSTSNSDTYGNGYSNSYQNGAYGTPSSSNPYVRQGAPSPQPFSPQNDSSPHPFSYSGNTSPYRPLNEDSQGYRQQPFSSPYENYPSPGLGSPYSSLSLTFPDSFEEPAKPKLRRGKIAFIGIIGMVIALLIGTGVGYSLPDFFHDKSTSQDSLKYRYDDGNAGPRNKSDNRDEPYMPYSEDNESQNAPHGSSPIQKGTKVKTPGVVLINTRVVMGLGAGTGVILTSDGLVVTNYHVVMGSEKIRVEIAETGKKYDAEVVGHDETRDIALLKLKNARNLTPAKISTTPAKVGDAISVVGNGSGQGYLTELHGKVLRLNQNVRIANDNGLGYSTLGGMIFTDADVVPGYSGGPMFNSRGEVVGIDTAASQGKTSEEVNGYAIPISKVMSVVNQIRRGESSGTVRIGRNAALGITVAKAPSGGVIIQAVQPDSGAREAGLENGDIILKLAGQDVRSPSQVAKTVRTYSQGDVVDVTVQKSDGSQQTVKVTLGASPIN